MIEYQRIDFISLFKKTNGQKKGANMLDWLRFPKTIFAAKKSLQDIKNVGFLFQLVTALVSIGYFIYALVTDTGLVWANAVALSLLVVFNVVRFTTREVPEKRSNRKTLKKVYRWIHIAIRAFTLAVMLYGVYAATSSNTQNQQTFALTVIYASIMVMMWIIQLVLEVILDLLDSKIEYITREFHKDMEPIMQDHVEPVMAKVNMVIETRDKIITKAEEIGNKTSEVVESIARPIKGFAETIRRKFGCNSEQQELPEVTTETEMVALPEVATDTTETEESNPQ